MVDLNTAVVQVAGEWEAIKNVTYEWSFKSVPDGSKLNDEHIEFRIDPDHYAIWVTSVGPMRVRIEQPAAFYGDLHVALTPTEFGNARLCAMQLTQGTLEGAPLVPRATTPSRKGHPF